MQLAPAQPPTLTATDSMTGATAGWRWRAPKESTGFPPAASTHSRAAVAQAQELDNIPKIVVS